MAVATNMDVRAELRQAQQMHNEAISRLQELEALAREQVLDAEQELEQITLTQRLRNLGAVVQRLDRAAKQERDTSDLEAALTAWPGTSERMQEVLGRLVSQIQGLRAIWNEIRQVVDEQNQVLAQLPQAVRTRIDPQSVLANISARLVPFGPWAQMLGSPETLQRMDDLYQITHVAGLNEPYLRHKVQERRG